MGVGDVLIMLNRLAMAAIEVIASAPSSGSSTRSGAVSSSNPRPPPLDGSPRGLIGIGARNVRQAVTGPSPRVRRTGAGGGRMYVREDHVLVPSDYLGFSENGKVEADRRLCRRASTAAVVENHTTFGCPRTPAAPSPDRLRGAIRLMGFPAFVGDVVTFSRLSARSDRAA